MLEAAFNRIMDCIDSCRNEEHIASCIELALLFNLRYANEQKYSLLLGAIAFKQRLLENQLAKAPKPKSQYPLKKPFISYESPINYN